MKNIIDFKGLQLNLASPAIMKSWSHGEITKPETINYRTLKPEKDGLFCERIFGPVKDWECACGKYKRIRYRGIICDKCGVEVTLSRVRRERMGHIQLASPVSHVWFFKGAPSKLSLILDISPRNLSGIIYFSQYVVLAVDKDKRIQVLENLDKDLESKNKELKSKAKKDIEAAKKATKVAISDVKKKLKTKEQQDLAVQEQHLKGKQAIAQIKDNFESELDNAAEVYQTIKDMVKRLQPNAVVTEDEYLKLTEYSATNHLKVGMGAEAVIELIQEINLEKLSAQLREDVKTTSGAKRIKATKRLRVIEGMKKAGLSPEWMILKILPVIPPDLRPMVQLSGGRFATSDLNDLYRRVINRNNRLKHLIDLGAPEIILRNEKRMLQESVDALIDSSQSRTTRRRLRKELRSLSDMLKGKQGRFRQNLLGKRVDYSGRSVIVVGPELKLNQCGIPKDMALEMFKPYVLRELIAKGIAPNVKSAKQTLEQRRPEVYDILEDITKKHPVLLNRAPTLHKLGIQSFFPILVEGSAIRIHPCVCAGYNADFDGDQMAVHVPLGKKAIKESIDLMMPEKNLLKPSDGSPITIPNKNMALGCYYLTSIDHRLPLVQTIFANVNEAQLAYQTFKIKLRQDIKVKLKLGKNQTPTILKTSIGRILFNQVLPQSLQFINAPINAAAIKNLVHQAIKTTSQEETMKLIDDLKDLGFQAETDSGLSVSVADNQIIKEKQALVDKANKKAAIIQDNFKQGLITEEEKRRLINEIWMETTDEIADKTWDSFSENNAVKIIINSGGTRASKDQVKQLAAMRGLVVDPLGKIVELPTKSNFREGLSIFEYVTSTRGSRKGLTDSALKTADAGYLTRRLVDVAHDAIIRQQDCNTTDGIDIVREGSRASKFQARIAGRLSLKTIKHPKSKKVLIKKNSLIDEEATEQLRHAGINKVAVRSPLTCQTPYGICAACYGRDLATNKDLVEIGTPAGVVAAQSIGEPGTQLTMRVKHTGGIVGLDVTQGLPRVEELFETRVPKALSPMTEIAGKVKVEETNQGYVFTITTTTKPQESKEYTAPLTSVLKVKTGDLVPVGAQLIQGSLDIKDVLNIKGLREAQHYLLKEIQAVYESQGIPINDRHFEVIIRKMSDKVKIENSGDTQLLPGQVIDKDRFKQANEAIAKGEEPSTANVIMLGITRSSLFTQSWLSAASFQDTTNRLTDAAVKGKIDNLLGLKENVIIGRLIPTSPKRAKLN